jgi:squid-like protein
MGQGQGQGSGGEDSKNGAGGDEAVNTAPSLVPATLGGAAKKAKDEDKRKLFVGGLSWDTKENDLKEYFAKFGEVEGLTYKTDAFTGRPRGFAFIIFADIATVEAVLAHGDHVINGKKVDPKMAKARPGKVFVGGLTPEITNEQVKEYFEQYGSVIDMEIPVDKSTNQRKSYCFVTFDDVHIAQELLKSPKQIICGKEVDVKQAQPQARLGGGGWDQSGAPRGRGGRGGGMRGGRGSGGRGGGVWMGYGGYGGAPDYGGGYDYYGGGGGYGYDGYGGYGGGYDGYGGGYDYSGSMRGTPRGRGGFIGKARGAPRGGVPRHTPY